MSRTFGTPVTDEQRSQWEAERQTVEERPRGIASQMADSEYRGMYFRDASIAPFETEAQREVRIIKAAVDLSTLRVKAELAAEAELRAEVEAAPAAPFLPRKLGKATEQAVSAGIALFFDSFGTSEFPRSKSAFAQAIADKATKLGITDAEKPLTSDSRTVRQVAGIMMYTARILERRDSDLPAD